MKSRLALAVAAIALLAACSGGGNAQSNSSQGTAQNAAASPEAAATNNTDFPLPDGSTVLTAHDWSKIVSASSSGGSGMFSQGAGTYAGHDTVAQTSESLADAQAWLKGLVAKPPKDYTLVPSSSSLDEARSHAAAIGLTFDAFQHTVNGKKQGVVVIVMDPKLLNEKAGPMLGLIGKYKMIPQSFRDPIDAKAKATTGFTISDALDSSQPIGAALGAITTLSSSGDRGIILVDATKQ